MDINQNNCISCCFFVNDYCHRHKIARQSNETCDKFKPNSEEQFRLFKVNAYLPNTEYFWRVQPFFYDKALLFWFWNKDKFLWELTDETEILINIEKKLSYSGETISSKVKNSYLEAFKRVGRQHIPKEPKKSWIQFKDMIYDFNTRESFKATPEYFICNPIPHSIGENDATPTIDKLFEDWVGKDNVQTLYEIIAYCCIIDYPIHRIFCFVGAGRNGKSCFQRLLQHFIGKENICSTELDTLMDSRFESTKLHKKLVCSLGETNFGILQKTSLLKRLTGQDVVGFEYKGKQPFDDLNYAKIVISSNSLPTSDDTSDGFFRRWIVINFDNEFPEGKDIIETIPEVEYSALARKVMPIVSDLMVKGAFSNEGSIEERKRRYIESSNPLPIFLNKYCETGDVKYVCKYGELYNAYRKYLFDNKKRKVPMKEFNDQLAIEGLYTVRRSVSMNNGDRENGVFIEGCKLKDNYYKIDNQSSLVKVVNLVNNNATQFSRVVDEVEKCSPESPKTLEIINLKCIVCGSIESNTWNKKGEPICENCYQASKGETNDKRTRM